MAPLGRALGRGACFRPAGWLVRGALGWPVSGSASLPKPPSDCNRLFATALDVKKARNPCLVSSLFFYFGAPGQTRTGTPFGGGF